MSEIEWDFSVSVFSDYDEDGHLVHQHDAPGVSGKEGVEPKETHSLGGLIHRALDPEKDAQGQPTEGATLLTIIHGDERGHIPLLDPRVVPKLPKVRKGGTALYGGAGEYLSFAVFDGQDPAGVDSAGSFTIGTPYAKSGAKKSHLFSMAVRKSGDEACVFAHGEGHGITMTMSGSRAVAIKNADGTCSVVVNDKGNTLNGKTKVIGSLTVGEPAAAQELVLANLLIVYLTALEARISSGVGVTPPVLPIAAVAKAMATKLLKGS